MIGLYSEIRELGNTTLSYDLAHHMLARQLQGRIAVVTDRPVPLMSAVRKQWLKIIRHMERERSSTLTARRLELTDELERLKNATFTTERPIADPQASICFATVEDFLQAAPVCNTLYIACKVERHEQYMLTSWMPPRSLVVVYDRR